MKKLLFVIHHLGVINIYMGLLGRHRLHEDQPRLRASRPTASPSRTSTTSETSTIWELVDNEASGQDLITPELLQMMGTPPKCDHQATCRLFVSFTEKNNRRLFWRCPHPRQRQCQYFKWTAEQPLQDYLKYQNQKKKGYPGSSSSQAVPQCQHLNVSRQGTNDLKILEKCLDCGITLIDRKTEKGIQKEKEKQKKNLTKSVYHQERQAMESTQLTPSLARRIIASGALEIGGVWTDQMADNSETQENWKIWACMKLETGEAGDCFDKRKQHFHRHMNSGKTL
jgi:hypothetical protein